MSDKPPVNAAPEPPAAHLACISPARRLAVLVMVIVWIAAVTLNVQRPLQRDTIEPTSLGVRINVNRDGEGDLMLLPGVGPKLAQRIVASRQGQGPFNEPADLTRVSGVGPKTVAKITPMISLDSETCSGK